MSKGWPCGSVAQLAECSHGKREALGSSPGRATIFSSPVTFWFSVGSRLGQRASKSACFVVPPLFRADSGTNLIKQGENIKGRPLAQELSCLTDSERPWVRVPVGPRFFLPLWHLVAQCGFAARATSIKMCMSRCSSVVPSRFGDESN